MTSSGSWKALDLQHLGAPKLLLKSHFTATGYHVQLTDLCRVWNETIIKRELIKRAWDDGCSIDPSEDDQQFKIFLEKIEGALQREDGTTMALLPTEDDGLLLRLAAPLPKPLPTLVWTVSLARQSDEELANVLTVPLLHQASNLQVQVQQLIHELQEKDRVISKITDRLETSGNDLTTVFPGVSNIKTNKKKSQREQLARHVKGLADFDEAAWRSRSVGGERSDLWERVDGVLRGLPESEGIDEDESVKDYWWLQLQIKPGPTANGNTPLPNSTAFPQVANGVDSSHEDSVVDDGFQRQGTPEHLKRRESGRSDSLKADDEASRPEAKPRHEDAVQPDGGDSTTEDEDDLDAVTTTKPTPSQDKRQSTPVSQPPASGPSKKLGALGGRSSKPPPSPARASTPTPTPTPEEQPQPAKSRSKLGAIGGKAKASQSAASPSAENTAPPVSSAPRKMGVIGGKQKPSNAVPPTAASPNATPSPEPVSQRSRAPTKEPTPQPRETSQERADRKRDELRRELEQKAKVPAKKKRKF